MDICFEGPPSDPHGEDDVDNAGVAGAPCVQTPSRARAARRSLVLTAPSRGRYACVPGGVSEAQRGRGTCLRSHSWWWKQSLALPRFCPEVVGQPLGDPDLVPQVFCGVHTAIKRRKTKPVASI